MGLQAPDSVKGPAGAELEIQIDGHTIAKGWHSPLKVDYDSTQQLDRVLEIRGIVRDGSQTVETVHHVTVDNIRVKGLHPSHLNLTSRKQKGYVWVKIESRKGFLALLPDTKIELRMRGGTPVHALSIEMDMGSRKAWVQFDRAQLVAAIRGALAAGNHGKKKKTKKVELGCYIDGHEVDQLKVKVRHGRWWR